MREMESTGKQPKTTRADEAKDAEMIGQTKGQGKCNAVAITDLATRVRPKTTKHPKETFTPVEDPLIKSSYRQYTMLEFDKFRMF
jgi:hypothetical protein